MPAERLDFVLDGMFTVPFDEIASIAGAIRLTGAATAGAPGPEIHAMLRRPALR